MVAIGAAGRARRAAHASLGDRPYNVVLRTAPPDRPAGEFHWYVDVLPRLGVVAGFEEGTGILVNVVPPEQAAVHLREAARRLDDRRRPALHDHRRPARRRSGPRWRTSRRTPSGWPTRSRSRSAPSSARGVGTEFECLTKIGPFTTTDVMTVTEWRPGVGDGHRAPRRRHRARLASRCTRSPGGLTELCWDEQLHYPWWMGGPVGERTSRPVLARIWRGNLDRLRAKPNAPDTFRGSNPDRVGAPIGLAALERRPCRGRARGSWRRRSPRPRCRTPRRTPRPRRRARGRASRRARRRSPASPAPSRPPRPTRARAAHASAWLLELRRPARRGRPDRSRAPRRPCT